MGIAALLCLDAALVALGWLAASESPLNVDPIVETNWTSPALDTPPAASEYARIADQDDPVLARPIFFASHRQHQNRHRPIQYF
jgi:hypothetical protein